MILFFRRSVLARNTLWMFAGQGVRLFIQALYFTLIARSLGAANYGAFVAVAALIAVVYPFGSLGSGNLLIKDVSRNQATFAACLGHALLITAVTSSILFTCVTLLARFVLPGSIPILLVCLVAGADLFGQSVVVICNQAFQAFERLHWMAIISVSFSASRLLAAVVLVLVNRHPSALQWGYGYFASTAIICTFALVLVLTRLGRPRFVIRRSPAELREGLYFSISLSAQTIYNDVDKTMLARLGSLDATGIYGAAYRLIEVSFVPAWSLLAAAYPKFFRAGSGGMSATFHYAKRLLVRVLAYAALGTLGILLCAGVVPYFLGPEYARTVEALRWLAPILVLRAIHSFLADALTGAGHQGLRSAIQASVAAFNILINFWLIPAYSWRGAAWSSILSDGLLACGIGAAAIVLSRRSVVPAAVRQGDLWRDAELTAQQLATTAINDQ